MDPQQTWGEMLDAFAAGDLEAAAVAAEVLMDWLKRGGFPPQPLTRVLSDDWDRLICEFICGQVFEAFQNQEIE
ncbi:hypothetical protein [Rubinisphaera italica]|uniref:Uncharacterized protein n=1 Tax=Rubinisphaera italica TaxID=2527969 RepID=A0A5C5XCF6_9PLAN|nr:hypothetical protein [Rubinisphaera italica]TWT60827.1 hypothetical protein Pan54_15540 [Rubinisphaera italica]